MLSRTIAHLVDREYCTVSILENNGQVLEWLRNYPYFAVMDEELRIVSVVVLADLIAGPSQQLIDIDLNKPVATPVDDIKEVTQRMLDHDLWHLPVYEHLEFVGVISLSRLTRELLKAYGDQFSKV